MILLGDEAKAIAYVESKMWPDGPRCPHCQVTERQYAFKSAGRRVRGARLGLRKCGICRRQYTVRIGTLFEDSKIPLSKWLSLIYLMFKNPGISARQLHREAGVSYKSAWFMCARVRETMKRDQDNLILRLVPREVERAE